MSETQEQPGAAAAPEPTPALEPPPPAATAAEPAPVAPPAAAPRRPGFARRVAEWFWRGAAIRAAAATAVFVPPRAAELHRRARLCAEFARRALEPSGPLASGSGDAVACELYREATYFALASLASARGEHALVREGALGPLFAATDRALLLRAAPDPAVLESIENALAGASFIDFAELRPEDQRELAWRLRQFVTALLTALDATQAKIDSLRFQRLWRVGAVLALFLVAIPIAVLLADWNTQRRDLAVGKSWKASSQMLASCVSPAQQCTQVQGHFFHTLEEDSPWLMIDLGSRKQFTEVRVANRSDCCSERAVPLVLEVSNDKKEWKKVAEKKEDFQTWKATFPDQKARYVRVRATRKTFLHLAGVRVLR